MPSAYMSKLFSFMLRKCRSASIDPNMASLDRPWLISGKSISLVISSCCWKTPSKASATLSLKTAYLEARQIRESPEGGWLQEFSPFSFSAFIRFRYILCPSCRCSSCCWRRLPRCGLGLLNAVHRLFSLRLFIFVDRHVVLG